VAIESGGPMLSFWKNNNFMPHIPSWANFGCNLMVWMLDGD